MQASLAVNPVEPAQFKRVLWIGMWAVIGLHLVVLLIVHPAPIEISRLLTAAVPILASVACLWRSFKLPRWHRPAWRWASLGLGLWAAAHIVEALISHSTEASNLRVDASDFVYLTATFPLLVAMSSTRETESLRSVFVLNCAQIGLAALLSYFLLYRMSMTPAAASTVMGKIYAASCLVLAVIAGLRSLFWSSEEERRTVLAIGAVIWTYMPIELGMDYATGRWGLHSGTVLDLVWSIPFLLGGWQALNFRIDPEENGDAALPGRGNLLVEALSPMMITVGIMGLAAAVTRQHMLIGLAAIFILLAIQGTQSALVQLTYLKSRNLLLEREQQLQTANVALEQLSLQDPLTGIANRRHFNSSLENAWRRAIRKRQAIALLMVDVDFFKGVNDQHGHSYGDQCLVSIAQTLSGHARRPDDVVARMGGEEFVVLLPDTDRAGAEIIAHWIHEAIKRMRVVNKASPFESQLTVSVGIAVSTPQPGAEYSALVECADLALYDAKGQGRNRTCWRSLD